MLSRLPFFRNRTLIGNGEECLGKSYALNDGTTFLEDSRVHIPDVVTLSLEQTLPLSKLAGVDVALCRRGPGEPLFIYYGRGLTDVFRFDAATGEWFHRFAPKERGLFRQKLPEVFGYGTFGPVVLDQVGGCEIAGMRFDKTSEIEGLDLGGLTAGFKDGELTLVGPAMTTEFRFDAGLKTWFVTQSHRD